MNIGTFVEKFVKAVVRVTGTLIAAAYHKIKMDRYYDKARKGQE